MKLPTIVLSSLAAALILLAGCDDGRTTRNVAPPRSPVTLLHYFTASLSGGAAELVTEFNAGNPSHELKAVSLDHEAFKSGIYDTLKAGNPPDLYSYWAGARTAAIVDQLEPIDDIWKLTGMDARFDPQLVEAAVEYEGKKYLLPISQHFVAFFYNKQVFAAHHLKPPETWDELLDICSTLRSAGTTPIALGAREKWPAQFWFDYLLLRSESFEFREALFKGKERFDDPRVLAAFARWKKAIDAGCFNASPHPNDLTWDTGANEMVLRGEAAMTLMGSWIIPHLESKRQGGETGGQFDFFPFPVVTPGIPRVAIGPIDGLVMPRRAANPAGAKAVLIRFSQIDAQKAFSRGSGALAPNRQIEDGFYGDIQRRVKQELARSEKFAFAFDLSTPPAVATLGLDAFAEFLAFPDAYAQIARTLTENTRAHFQSFNPASRNAERP